MSEEQPTDGQGIPIEEMPRIVDEEELEQWPDSFGIVVSTGIWDVEYDLMEVQNEDGPYEYRINIGGGEVKRGQFSISIGNIPIEIAKAVSDDLEERYGTDAIFGFVVEDHQIAHFAAEFPDKELFRKRDEE